MKSLHTGFLYKILILCSALFFSFIGHSVAQCMQSSIYLSSQAEVNAFKTNYGCVSMTGSLVINGSTITNLDSLHLLEEVGALHIQNTSLVNLEELSSLHRISGLLVIDYNANLTSLNGLEDVAKVGELTIYSNNSLTSLSGLDGLRVVEGQAWISENAVLQNLSGLNLLDSVRNRLLIDDNDLLFNLEGLNNLSSVWDH